MPRPVDPRAELHQLSTGTHRGVDGLHNHIGRQKPASFGPTDPSPVQVGTPSELGQTLHARGKA